MNLTNRPQLLSVSLTSSVCIGLCNRGHCLCNARPTLKHSLSRFTTVRTWYPIDVTYSQTIGGLVLPNFHTILIPHVVF